MKTSVKIGRKYWHKLLFIFGLLIFANCRFGNDANEINLTEPQVEIDLPQVMERGKLIALTGYDVTSYFIYKGRPMGFEYDLLNRFANHLGVELEIVVIRDLDRLFDELNKGRGDLLAYNLTITQERQERVMFTDHHTVVRQVLIQRLPKNWRNMPQYKIDRMLLRNSIDLIGKTVHVRKGSSYYERLQNLEQEIGGDIDIVEVPGDVTTEELIRRVADGEIDYTVADENIAWINSAYYDNIDTQRSISVRQRIAWSVRKNSPLLRDAVNEWLSSIKSEPTFNIIYNKYYRNRDFSGSG
ncbi:MAG: transporter substrate-binding domain-containing protein [Calditrichia bacterium]